MKALPLLVLSFAALLQWGIPLRGIWEQEHVLAHGTLFKVKCGAPDPYDPIRGRYLAVRPLQDRLPVPLNLKKGSELFASVSVDSEGWATFGGLSHTPPAEGGFVKVRSVGRPSEGTVAVQWPFARFYLNEKMAPEADQWIAKNIRDQNRLIAEIRVLKGKAVLADLVVEGKPLREILKAAPSP